MYFFYYFLINNIIDIFVDHKQVYKYAYLYIWRQYIW